MQTTSLMALALAGLGASAALADPGSVRFSAPQRLQADGAWVKVEPPGYAFPAWADVTGDGRDDLVVGQFTGGKLNVFARRADGTFAAGGWLRVDGKPAEVPGVW